MPAQLLERRARRRDRDLRRRELDRIAVDAGRDRGERDRAAAELGRELERAPVARGEQLRLAAVAAAPDRARRCGSRSAPAAARRSSPWRRRSRSRRARGTRRGSPARRRGGSRRRRRRRRAAISLAALTIASTTCSRDVAAARSRCARHRRRQHRFRGCAYADPASPCPARTRRCSRRRRRCPADMVFIDLEDAVAPLEKNDATRQNVVDALTGLEWTAPTRVVRVNDVATALVLPRHPRTSSRAHRTRSTASWCRRSQGPDQVRVRRITCSRSSRPSSGMTKRIGLEIQIESARGAENLPAIADASDRIETIIFGPGDYAADLGIPQLTVGAHRRRSTPATSGTTSSRASSSRRGRAACRRSTARTRRSATSRASARSPSARRGSAATASGRCTRPDRDPQRGLPPVAGAVRARRGAARRLPPGDRGRPPRRGHVGGRDDRRGLAQDGRAGRRARPRAPA